MENCTGLKPILEDVDLDSEPDPIRAIAKKYYHLPCSVMTPNPRRFDIPARVGGASSGRSASSSWSGRPASHTTSNHFIVRKLAEEELHLPYLKITTDYSPSDSARISARVEALFETIRARTQ